MALQQRILILFGAVLAFAIVCRRIQKDKILVEATVAETTTASGLVIPDTAKEKPQEGKVLAIGKKRDDDGKEIPFDVKVGDTVLMPKYGGTEVKIDDKTYQIVREEDLLGVIG